MVLRSFEGGAIMPARTKRAGHKDRKIISVSSKRQITIPKKFFRQLKFGKEVECFLEDDGIVIRPIQLEENEFSIEILRELVSQGYSGEELIKKFEAERKKSNPR